ncbi:MAG TPA: alpha/beta fold hydrolase [Anaerolineales bacterium]|nr:alpha/beta fold hydrolase [Anaerolineales bacterium]
MGIDIALYRRQVQVSSLPVVRLSAIDISPDSPKHTLVFLHGYGGQAKQWEYQLQEFSFSNRVIALDLRGHGRSDKPDCQYTMPLLLRDLEIALAELNVGERFILVGHSFGGAIATEYAVIHPERVEKLILIATAAEFRLNPLYRALLALPLTLLRGLTPFVRGWLSAPPQVMHSWYHHNLARWNGWSLFRSLGVPTMVIRGHLDLVFARSMFDQVASAIPDADEVDVGASGHLVMLERRAAVNRAIHRCLEQDLRTWRDEAATPQSSARAALIKERPWLQHYDEGVPYTVAVPSATIPELLRSSAHRFPDHTALSFAGQRISYRRLNLEVNRFAQALQATGSQPGDRVMLLLPNLPQMVIAYFGTLAAGGVAVFTLPATDPEELIRQVSESAARMLVSLAGQEALVNQIAGAKGSAAIPFLEHVIFTNPGDYLPRSTQLAMQASRRAPKPGKLDEDLPVAVHSYTQLLGSQNTEALEIALTSENLAVIQFTGGTTAIPKGVMLSHRNLVANALQTRHWMPNAREGKERFLSVLPFSHSYGLTTALNLPIVLGATLILKPTFEVAEILRTIQHDRPTIFPGVPRMYVAIKDFPGVRKYGISSVQACISGSAPLPVEVQEAFEKLTHGRLVEGYGLTEAGPVTHGNPLYGKRKIGSIGIPLPSTEARVVDLIRGRKEVSIGQIGELAVRGPQVMLGYWDRPKETRRVINPDGFLLTGDVAQMDAEGYFRIIARKADMWYPEKPGKPAFPRDIEEVLFEVPQVKEAVVVAIASQPIAFVITQKEGLKPEALIAYCRRRLPPELVPRLVIFVDDFPRTFIGKVIRRELAKRYEQNHLEREEHDLPISADD